MVGVLKPGGGGGGSGIIGLLNGADLAAVSIAPMR